MQTICKCKLFVFLYRKIDFLEERSIGSMLHILEHSLIDSIKLLPFLFLTYLAMELLEHYTGNKLNEKIQNAGKLGPLWGAFLGVVPQCGFSTAAAFLFGQECKNNRHCLNRYMARTLCAHACGVCKEHVPAL